MPRPAVEEALVLHLAADRRAKGAQMPRDLDFLRRARIYFVDANNKQVEFNHVMIAWEDADAR